MSADLMVISADDARSLTDQIKVAVEGTWELIKRAYVSRAWSALGYRSWDDYCTREFGTSRLRLPREERQEVVGSLRDAGLSLRAIAAATGYSEPTVRRELAASNDAPATPTVTCPNCGNVLSPGETCEGCYPPPLEAAADFDFDAATRRMRSDVERWADDEPALTDEECRALADPDDLDDDEPEPERRITGVDGRSYPAVSPRKPSRKPLTDAFWRAAYDLGKKVDTLTNLAADDRFNRNADQIRADSLPDLIRARDALQCVIESLTN